MELNAVYPITITSAFTVIYFYTDAFQPLRSSLVVPHESKDELALVLNYLTTMPSRHMGGGEWR
jgi:hypothetical protein